MTSADIIRVILIVVGPVILMTMTLWGLWVLDRKRRAAKGIPAASVDVPMPAVVPPKAEPEPTAYESLQAIQAAMAAYAAYEPKPTKAERMAALREAAGFPDSFFANRRSRIVTRRTGTLGRRALFDEEAE